MVSAEYATGRVAKSMDTPGLIVFGTQAQMSVFNGASRLGTTGDLSPSPSAVSSG